jgi:tRNA (adenine22-N1)-methyltransferase
MSPRQRAVAAAVPLHAASAADVGAGDGHLAAALASRGLRVVATEAGEGPYRRLREKTPGVDCRLGDGLRPLRQGEVDGAVLAGMGGRTIASILERDGALARSLEWLVLQPQQHAHQLETWLEGEGFIIQRGEWTMQGRRLYRVLLVEPPS